MRWSLWKQWPLLRATMSALWYSALLVYVHLVYVHVVYISTYARIHWHVYLQHVLYCTHTYMLTCTMYMCIHLLSNRRVLFVHMLLWATRFVLLHVHVHIYRFCINALCTVTSVTQSTNRAVYMQASCSVLSMLLSLLRVLYMQTYMYGHYYSCLHLFASVCIFGVLVCQYFCVHFQTSITVKVVTVFYQNLLVIYHHSQNLGAPPIVIAQWDCVVILKMVTFIIKGTKVLTLRAMLSCISTHAHSCLLDGLGHTTEAVIRACDSYVNKCV